MAELAASLQSDVSENSQFGRQLPSQQCFPATSLEKKAGVSIDNSLDYATEPPGTDQLSEREIESSAPQQDRQLLVTAEATHNYRLKAFELMTANVKVNLEYAKELKKLRTPFEFIELSTTHARKQFELITSPTEALAALSRSLTTANAERMSAGIEKVFGRRKT